MTSAEIIAAESRYLVQAYRRQPVAFVRGTGARLFDAEGRAYIDFAAGIAVAALGQADPEWVAAVTEQAATLTHVSSLFHNEPQVELARQLTELSFADRVFYSNSGAEANEAALKFARRWAGRDAAPGRTGLVAFEGGFHGRSLGALSLTAKSRYREPFAPLVPGVSFAPFNDLGAAERAIDATTCAVFVEPVQGEAGVRPATPEFLAGLRRLCDDRGALLVFDEVQCGLGRTGRLWAHEASGITPDIMTIAKPLAGGLPIGVTLVTERVASAIEPGDHGSTFGGGPLVCRAAQVVLRRIATPDFLAGVRRASDRLLQGLRALRSPRLTELRGEGLLIGVEFETPVAPLVRAALERGLVLITAGDNVLRLAPPLVITEPEIDAGLEILRLSLPALDAKDAA